MLFFLVLHTEHDLLSNQLLLVSELYNLALFDVIFRCIFSAAWVHRGFSDDVTELVTLQPGGDLLTDFQKDKFRYFFNHVLDMNGDMVISWEDFEKLNEVNKSTFIQFQGKNNGISLQRMRHYMDWSVNSVQYLALKELHETFLDCFLTTASNFVKKDEGKQNVPHLQAKSLLFGFKMQYIYCIILFALFT